MRRVRELAITPWFRLLVAVLFLVAHLMAFSLMASGRFGLPFNSAPSTEPAFADPSHDNSARHWNRLIVARWDAGHYTSLALRGYSQCPHATLTAENLRGYLTRCDLDFYPGYGLFGRLVSLGGKIPIDVAMFASSLVASLVFLFLFTDRSITQRLGVGGTYLALLLFNAFTTGFALVTIQTEPTTLAFTLGAFVCLDRKRYVLGGALAGAATALRVTAAATGVAFALAIIIEALLHRPKGAKEVGGRILAAILSFWGVGAMMGYHLIRFGDALLYVHAHEQSFSHSISLLSLLLPSASWIKFAINNPLHEGIWLTAAVLAVLLGHRRALERFPIQEQVFWYALTVVCVGIAAVGQIQIGFVGMNRYLLLALPVFFSMASVFRRQPLVVGVWLWVSLWHYWNSDLCHYVGGPGNDTLRKCNDAHWIGTF